MPQEPPERSSSGDGCISIWPCSCRSLLRPTIAHIATGTSTGHSGDCATVSHASHRCRVCTHPGGRVGSTARHACALKMLAISRHGRRPHGPVRSRRWGIHEPRRRAGPECSDRSFSKCRPQRAGLECSDRSFSKCRPQHQPCGCDGHDVAEEGCVARASSSPTQRDHVQVRVARLDRT